MSQNVRKISSADYGIGITGIAGPTAEASVKPIGTVFISIATRNKVTTKRFHFLGSRLEVKRKTAVKSLSMLKEFL
jgi:nicotinamide-nucleotide amidase